eukprot:CAMPEP_0182441676 /NCGR_PEP_ID=MMETSP1172-20130603/659_1 /TAXON_ID=708627 /ORGANISM="Timspurckia oligopyrenoides, Strain CCMP3278" /LENGTH=222 /DNA_ID=CAMNT_0024636119 /DNA_START=31 /DNA_END=699 /DNA_ORIENTATION=+
MNSLDFGFGKKVVLGDGGWRSEKKAMIPGIHELIETAAKSNINLRYASFLSGSESEHEMHQQEFISKNGQKSTTRNVSLIKSQESSQHSEGTDETEEELLMKMKVQEMKGNYSQLKRPKLHWTSAEDEMLKCLLEKYGMKRWRTISEVMKDKTGKQCRERWVNHLDPNIRKSQWTVAEDKFILQKQKEIGNKWNEISKCMEGRSENAIKNRFNAFLKANLVQ